jgi:hypothetical protein
MSVLSVASFRQGFPACFTKTVRFLHFNFPIFMKKQFVVLIVGGTDSSHKCLDVKLAEACGIRVPINNREEQSFILPRKPSNKYICSQVSGNGAGSLPNATPFFTFVICSSSDIHIIRQIFLDD